MEAAATPGLLLALLLPLPLLLLSSLPPSLSPSITAADTLAENEAYLRVAARPSPAGPDLPPSLPAALHGTEMVCWDGRLWEPAEEVVPTFGVMMPPAALPLGVWGLSPTFPSPSSFPPSSSPLRVATAGLATASRAGVVVITSSGSSSILQCMQSMQLMQDQCLKDVCKNGPRLNAGLGEHVNPLIRPRSQRIQFLEFPYGPLLLHGTSENCRHSERIMMSWPAP